MPYPPPGRHDRLLFIELQTTESTNNYALSRVYAGLAQHGNAIFAHEQSKGKGQRGKTWASVPGENVALSLIINPAPLAIAQQFSLSICVATACLRVLKKYLGDDVRIKWPNDLYWQDRKAGGILIENSLAGENWKWAVVGIGLNINQTLFPSELKNPVSFKQITGKTFSPIDLASEIASEVLHQFDKLLREGNTSANDYYKSNLYRVGEKVKLKAGPRIFEAKIVGVRPDGKLVVKHQFEEEFSVGEIEWLQ